ncbi:unnamed protein product [Pleuronectes platessa]|uniref:Uncharacterized protein n=1 Tax=Pleuronectes platessa TaxID=8262 RepID=A0A9N7YAH8_PLEPL|nr:unnamed protein product [Pleuronectes platessa]
MTSLLLRQKRAGSVHRASDNTAKTGMSSAVQCVSISPVQNFVRTPPHIDSSNIHSIADKCEPCTRCKGIVGQSEVPLDKVWWVGHGRTEENQDRRHWRRASAEWTKSWWLLVVVVTVLLLLPVNRAEEAPTLSCVEGRRSGTVAEGY